MTAKPNHSHHVDSLLIEPSDGEGSKAAISECLLSNRF